MNTNKMILFLFFAFCHISYSQSSKWQIVDSVRYYKDGSKYPTVYFFKAIDCFDKNNFAAVGNMNDAYPWNRITTDGGKTWKTTLKDTAVYDTNHIKIYNPPKSTGICYPDTNLCIVICDSGYYWRSVNHCQTWVKGKVDVKSKYSLLKICFFDKSKGAIIDDEELFLTNNGGIDWEKAKINYHDSIKSLYFSDVSIINENLIYLCVNYSTDRINYKTRIYFSYDFGQNWDFHESEMIGAYKMKFINANSGWALASKRTDSINYYYRNIILFTNDSGKTWKKQLDTLSFPNPLPLINIYFVDSLNGLSFGYWYKIWRTTDGGIHWLFDEEYFKRPTQDYLIDLFLINSNSYFGVTINVSAYIYKYINPTSVFEFPFFRDNINDILIVSPNPASDFIEISVGARRAVPGEENIRIYNVLGEELKNLTPALSEGEGVRIDVSTLPAGVYFVKVGDKVGKFVKL